ncbi:Endopolyphosphatase [Tulasnella sp. JGI-2019a]|nr:Endopolyphosphatase [Tulasnella sp. JGI-2019a]
MDFEGDGDVGSTKGGNDFDDGDVETQKNRKHGHKHTPHQINCTRKKNRDKEECLLKGPRHAHKSSPSRRNGLWSPLGYTQFVIPDLDGHKRSDPPKYEIEYMTYPLASLAPPSNWPVPQHLLPESLRNLTEIPTNMTSVHAPFGLKDLTIPSWIKLARKLSKKKKLFKKFKTFMYQGGKEE